MQDTQIITNYENDIKWFKSHADEIRKEFKNKFVAIKDSKILDSDADVDILIKKLNKKGTDPSFVLIEFMPEKEMKLILKR